MSNNKLKDRLLKNTTIKLTDSLGDSEVYNNKRVISTPVPIINLALSGSFDGGLRSGVGQLAGPSKHFKSQFGLLLCRSFLESYQDGIVLFYDSEMGTTLDNFKAMGTDYDRVIHSPITNLEELKIDLFTQLKEMGRGDNVMIFIDSIGNLASLKEVNDADAGESKADMTRAKEMKSFGRIFTPIVNLKDIPMVIVNHVYKEIGVASNPKYAKNVVSGGTGLYLSSDWIWMLGKHQDKDGDDIVGNDFIINIEKSRFVREKSKFQVNVSYKDGIPTYTGLFDLAVELDIIYQPTKGWYNVRGWDGANFRRSDKENDADFWAQIMSTTTFKTDAETAYKLAVNQMIEDNEEE
jgi:RecA/RadA recombinase